MSYGPEPQHASLTPELEKCRHSSAHIMAQAVKRLFPNAKMTIGPAIETGFYYDFDLDHPFSVEDLSRIEDEMKKIVAEDFKFSREEIPREEAIKLFEKMGEPFKVEILKEIQDGIVSTYRQGEFLDLCRGPHLESTGKLKAFKLLSVAGAYWRGNEKNKMLQRIYGTAFPSRQELESYLKQLEESKLRDHRRLGKELGLFSIYPEAGPGLIFWHPKGGRVRWILENFWRDEHFKRGYEFVYSPHVARLELWKKSGHWDYYRESMYPPMELEEDQYVAKPMNCPGHILMFRSGIRSYRDLPLRFAELGTVYRFERTGVLHGLMRVRGFTQDDAHIFCAPDQLQNEIQRVLELVDFMMKVFGFQYQVALSTRPEKFVGEVELWDQATRSLEEALKTRSISYKIDLGEGVFYGPKIDIKLIDALGRGWQGPTIQVDFNLPHRFEATFVASDGKHHPVVMVHRAVWGSMERFLGILIEHFRGAFPLWLAPVQVKVLPITSSEIDYAKGIIQKLTQASLRCELDDRPEKIGFKIREAQGEKIPYMLIVGDREKKAETVAVRNRKKGDMGVMAFPAFLDLALKEISEKIQ
ncbi:MAG: threonine--tRNA ligase [Chlamydiae bacterium]|nr:threonine--tRNA ligase [Chlamydiota bacterium]MBI3277213.1 threonine--tRNA ligase [Chlamydiota bacterium]